MRILILGDCHGQLETLASACENAVRKLGVKAAIQVGDFGFNRRVIDSHLDGGHLRFAVPLYAIDGNHEDHEWLKMAQHWGGTRSWEASNLFYQPRGSVAHIGGISFGFLGGALHVDRHQEWCGRDIFPLIASREVDIPDDPGWSNWITRSEFEQTLDAYRKCPPDIMITHSCPAGIGIGMNDLPALKDDVHRYITKCGFRAGPEHDCGDILLARIWRRLRARPKAWIYGHFHCVHERSIDGTQFMCVGSSDNSDGTQTIRAFVVDTKDPSLSVRLFPDDLSRRISSDP